MDAESSVLCRRFLFPSQPALDKGLIQNPCLLVGAKLGAQIWGIWTRSPFWILTTLPSPSPLLPSLCLLMSVSSSDLMDQTYVRAATCLRDKMASSSSPSPISFRAIPDLISTAPPWQSCAPVTRRARQNPSSNRSRIRSARLGQRSQLAVPK